MKPKNPYQVLGVERDADPATIKKAYRRLARQHHPDRDGDPRVFAELADAYAILSDEKKRARYDETGDVETRTTEAMAVELVFSMFTRMVEQHGPAVLVRDPFRMVLNNLANRTRDIEREEREMERREQFLADLRKRIGKKDGTGDENIFEIMFVGTERAIKAKREGWEEEKRVIRLAVKLLDDYTFKCKQASNTYDRRRHGVDWNGLADAMRKNTDTSEQILWNAFRSSTTNPFTS